MFPGRRRCSEWQAMAKRDFVFADEYGDPGPFVGSNSTHFASLAVHVTDESLGSLVNCFASMRFFRQAYREMKRLHSNPQLRPVLRDMLAHISAAHGVRLSVAFVDKARYTGPYLTAGSGRKFRNFQLRQLLEWHFQGHECVTRECELVIDRHSTTDAEESELRRYLRGNWSLPAFVDITVVDSRYVEVIQVADLALTLFRKKHLERTAGYVELDLDFIAHKDVSRPRHP